MSLQKHLSGLGILSLVLVYGCVKQQIPGVQSFTGILVDHARVSSAEEPGEMAFFSFLQNLSDPNRSVAKVDFLEEASLFLPDSTIHTNLFLFGVELNYTDSTRLIYYDFSDSVDQESHAYIGVFSKGGKTLDVLPIKEASFNGNAAVNIIDQEIIELEYYAVYDAEGYQQNELAFEYFKVDNKGQLQQLSMPISYTSDRQFVEASTRLLSFDELKRYTPEQLEIMEMELLADYGQRFDVKKWQSYFEQQSWYTPRHQEVEDLLSGLELTNLRKLRLLALTL